MWTDLPDKAAAKALAKDARPPYRRWLGQRYRADGRDVAQPGSASHWGCGGRRFESSRPDQFFKIFMPSDHAVIISSTLEQNISHQPAIICLIFHAEVKPQRNQKIASKQRLAQVQIDFRCCRFNLSQSFVQRDHKAEFEHATKQKLNSIFQSFADTFMVNRYCVELLFRQ